MKNLKKVLALVLVIAMVMGFAVSASAAEFSDADQVAEQNQTAVEVLSALNIINGFTDGTYRPEASVTRAQVAKMLAVAFNEGDESINDLYRNAPTTLTDISGTWAEGYIKYMANVGYINGFPDGTYRPDDAVTANQLCQIMLNILGYDIDTTVSWATAVQAKSFSIGLLKNVSTAVGSDCPRQEAAQIIYNALNMDLLQENALGVKVPSGETILTKYLNGYVDTVVVTGNEYADLNGTKPLDAGKTEVDGKTTLNWSTDLDAIGEAYTIWATKGGANNNDTVIYADNTGLNEIEEINTASNDLSKDIKMKTTDADTYLNFGNTGYYVSDYKLTWTYFDKINVSVGETSVQDKYTLVEGVYTKITAEGTAESGKTYYDIETASVKADAKITTAQYDQILEVFNYDELSIYIGTYTGSDANVDQSDVMSAKQFVAKYLTADASASVTTNKNGNYVKVIDNDGDGVAEYILQTTYTLDEITKIKEQGPALTYSFNGKGIDTTKDGNVDKVVPMYDDAAAGDVVVYAIIDRVAYLYKADMTTETVKSYSFSKDTITTTDDNTYAQSGIGNDTEYADQIVDMNEKTEYEIFFDLFGNVRAYRLVDSTTKFALLTEAYTSTIQNSKYVTSVAATVEAKLGDADTAEYNVTNYSTVKGNDFFTAQYVTGKNEKTGKSTYSELYTAFFTRNQDENTLSSEAKTNVAIYTESEDGLAITSADVQATDRSGRPLYYNEEGKQVTTKRVGYEVYATKYISLTKEDIKAGTWKFNGTDGGENVVVNAVHDTEFYLVTDKGITYFTDYTKVPSITGEKISAIYTVAENTSANSSDKDYWVADVVVIELENWNLNYDSIALGYWNSSRTTSTVKSIDALDNVIDGVEATLIPTAETWDDQWKSYGFYQLFSTTTEDGTITAKTIEPIISGFSTYGIYSGTINYTNKVESRGGYIVVDGNKVNTDNVPVYEIVADRSGAYVANELDITDLAAKDDIIYVMNKAKTAVSFIVRVDETTTPAKVYAVYTDIESDQAKTNAPTLTVKTNLDNAEANKTSLTEAGTITIKPNTGYEFTAATDVTVTVVGTGAAVTAPTEVENDGTLKVTVTGITANDTVVITGAATLIDYTINATALTDAGYSISNAKVNDVAADPATSVPSTAHYGDVITFTVTSTTAKGATENDYVIKAGTATVGTLKDGVSAVNADYATLDGVSEENFAVLKLALGDRLYVADDASKTNIKVATQWEESKSWFRLETEGVDPEAATATVSITVGASTITSGTTTVTVVAPSAE